RPETPRTGARPRRAARAAVGRRRSAPAGARTGSRRAGSSLDRHAGANGPRTGVTRRPDLAREGREIRGLSRPGRARAAGPFRARPEPDMEMLSKDAASMDTGSMDTGSMDTASMDTAERGPGQPQPDGGRALARRAGRRPR